LATALAVVINTLVFRKLLKRAQASESRTDDAVIPFLSKLVSVIILMVGALLVGIYFGLDIRAAIAGSGLVALLLAFAFRPLVANIITACVTVFRGGICIGDYIRIMKWEGIVEKIGLQAIHLRTPSGSLVSINMSKVSSETIENFTCNGNRQFEFMVKIRNVVKINQFEAFEDELNKHNIKIWMVDFDHDGITCQISAEYPSNGSFLEYREATIRVVDHAASIHDIPLGIGPIQMEIL